MSVLPADARVVERARVHGASADDAPRLRFVLEDALRTAELGDRGRLVVVRRLRLIGLPLRCGPGRAARALEAAWALQVQHAVPAIAPAAADAPAVWFGSRQQAREAFLRAFADADAATLAHWYWPPALSADGAPAWPAAPALQAAAVWHAACIEAAPAFIATLAAWPDRRLVALARRWVEAAVPAALPVPASPAVQPRAGPARLGSDAVDDASAVLRQPAASALLRGVAERLALHLPLALPVASWVVQLWWQAAAGRPAEAAQVEAALELAFASTRDAPAFETQPSRARAAAGAPRDRPASHGAPRAAPRGSPDRAVHLAAPNPDVPAPPARLLRIETPPPRRATARAIAAQRPWLDDARSTDHGGLLFVLNLLPALRFPAWLDLQPDRDCFVDRLFVDLLDATGAAPDDPQRLWFDADAGGADQRTRAWRLRLRRLLRRRVRVDLDVLVRRPALASATPTHIDLVFALDDVDLRLRRAGLDIDPGWLPWFGRIVTFHYV